MMKITYLVPLLSLPLSTLGLATESATLDNGIGWEWSVDGPCTDGSGNDATTVETQICFKSTSDEMQTFTLDFDFGEFLFEDLALPIGPGASTCTTYTYKDEGIYENKFTVKVGSTSYPVSFNNPWRILEDGSCVPGQTPAPVATPVPEDTTTTTTGDDATVNAVQSQSNSSAGAFRQVSSLLLICSVLGAFMVGF